MKKPVADMGGQRGKSPGHWAVLGFGEGSDMVHTHTHTPAACCSLTFFLTGNQGKDKEVRIGGSGCPMSALRGRVSKTVHI